MPKSDAKYYQSHKDDDKEWAGPAPAAKPQMRRLAAMVSVRFTPDEEKLLRVSAAKRHESLSGFVRRAALAACTGVSVEGQVRTATILVQGSTTGVGGAIEFPGGRFMLVARQHEAGGTTVRSA